MGALPVDIDPKAPHVRCAIGKVDLVGLAEASELLLAHQPGGEFLRVFGGAGRLIQIDQLAVHPHDGRATHLQVKV